MKSIFRDPLVIFVTALTVIISVMIVSNAFAPERKKPEGETKEIYDHNQFNMVYNECVKLARSNCDYDAKKSAFIVMQWNGSQWVKVFK